MNSRKYICATTTIYYISFLFFIIGIIGLSKFSQYKGAHIVSTTIRNITIIDNKVYSKIICSGPPNFIKCRNEQYNEYTYSVTCIDNNNIIYTHIYVNMSMINVNINEHMTLIIDNDTNIIIDTNGNHILFIIANPLISGLLFGIGLFNCILMCILWIKYTRLNTIGILK